MNGAPSEVDVLNELLNSILDSFILDLLVSSDVTVRGCSESGLTACQQEGSMETRLIDCQLFVLRQLSESEETLPGLLT